MTKKTVEDVFSLVRRGVADEAIRKSMYATTSILLQVCQTLEVVNDVNRVLELSDGLTEVLVVAGCPRTRAEDYFSRLEELLVWYADDEDATDARVVAPPTAGAPSPRLLFLVAVLSAGVASLTFFLALFFSPPA